MTHTWTKTSGDKSRIKHDWGRILFFTSFTPVFVPSYSWRWSLSMTTLQLWDECGGYYWVSCGGAPLGHCKDAPRPLLLLARNSCPGPDMDLCGPFWAQPGLWPWSHLSKVEQSLLWGTMAPPCPPGFEDPHLLLTLSLTLLQGEVLSLGWGKPLCPACFSKTLYL